jgi:hypothetical protein
MFEKIRSRWQEARGVRLKDEFLDATRRLGDLSEDDASRFGETLHRISKNWAKNYGQIESCGREFREYAVKDLKTKAQQHFNSDVGTAYGYVVFSFRVESSYLPGEDAQFVRKFTNDFIEKASSRVEAQSAQLSDSQNKLPEGNVAKRRDEIVDIAERLLALQLTFIADERERIPASATDNFSIGYVAGFLDAMMQRAGIDDDGESFAMVAILMMKLFGEKLGTELCRRFLDSQHLPETRRGLLAGGRESLGWLSSAKRTPVEWVQHCK